MPRWPIGIRQALSPIPTRRETNTSVSLALTLLQSGAGEVAIRRYLSRQLVEHFGLPASDKDVAAVAARVQRWFESMKGDLE